MSNVLQAHIEAENAKHADSYFSVVSDPAHWAGYGITTVEQYEHYMAAETYIDMFKELNGIKPRWMDFSQMTLAEIELDIARLNEQWAGEAEWQAEDDAFRESTAEENHRYNEMNSEPEADKYEVMAEQAGF